MASVDVPTWMRPSEWFQRVVEPCAQTYREDPDCEWKAVAAAVLTHYLADRVFKHCEHNAPDELRGAGSTNALVRLLAIDQPALDSVWEAADATKHHYLDRSFRGDRINVATAVLSRAPDGFKVGEHGPLLAEVIFKAVAFWKAWLSVRPAL